MQEDDGKKKSYLLLMCTQSGTEETGNWKDFRELIHQVKLGLTESVEAVTQNRFCSHWKSRRLT